MSVRDRTADRSARGVPFPALVASVAWLVAHAALGAGGALAQSTPVIPAPGEEAPTIATVPPSDAAGDPTDGGPVPFQTIAQGLVEVDGTVVWRVRQIEPAAEPESAEGTGFSFTLQREGRTLVEDEVAGRGALLETDEAFFAEAGAAFARRAEGAEPAIAWVIELVAPDARAGDGLAAGTVLFTSDLIDDYPGGLAEAELRRGVLLPGESAELPVQTGPSLVMVTDGRLQIGSGDGAATAQSAGSAVLAPEAPTITNGDTQPAVFVVAAIGDPVETAAASAAEPTSDATPAAEPATAGGNGASPTPIAGTDSVTAETPATADLAPTATDTDGDGLGDEEEVAYGSDPLNSDYDADGLLDGAEVNQHGSDPVNNDTDGDTLVDGDEVDQFGSNPASTDGDGDGIGDASEIYEFGTSPSNYDTDGDGAPDGDETAAGTDPNDATSAP